ncbi:MAG: energy-coupling factor transporter transmembrane component T [Bryobacteraceae bacterium]|nr:energy-coupling factor transporter transmembrane component T [Bryobacteraceae bacterium]
MHHVVLERWSRGASALHRLDARAKLIALFALLVALSLTPPAGLLRAAAFLLAVVLSGLVCARLPLTQLLLRAAVVLPFSASVALVSWFAGDPSRAISLLLKSYLSASLVLLVVATTPMPDLLTGLKRLGLPAVLTLVIQFVYRYLFVISEQAQHMRLASAARLGAGGFRISAGAVAVLFARSLARAEHIHWAMLARCGVSTPRPLLARPFGPPDVLFTVCAVAAAAALAILSRP